MCQVALPSSNAPMVHLSNEKGSWHFLSWALWTDTGMSVPLKEPPSLPRVGLAESVPTLSN